MKMDAADKYFNCTDSERAAFEAGIKLGTVYHQFVGAPISQNNVEVMESAIAEGAKVQPFVKDAKVNIDRSRLREKSTEFDYITLTGDMLDVHLVIKFKNVELTCEMKHISEMDYPLMYVKEVKKD
jgi:hypothetical protein